MTWFNPKEKLPEDEQECLLMPVDHGGMSTIPVFGPIAWSAKEGNWIDIFRDPEAGTVVRPTQVGLWRDWESIAPPDDQ